MHNTMQVLDQLVQVEPSYAQWLTEATAALHEGWSKQFLEENAEQLHLAARYIKQTQDGQACLTSRRRRRKHN